MSIPTLHPFQIDVVDRVKEAILQGARRIILQAATGAGKTNCAAYIVKRAVAKGSDVLLLVHRRRLVDQISGRLHEFEVQHGIIMRDEPMSRECRVQVASRDTMLSRCLNNSWLGLPPARIVIVDEAHHAAQPDSEYRRIIEHYRDAVVLLLTATPVGPDGKGMGPWAQALICAAPTSQLVRDGYLCPVKVFAPERKRKGNRLLRGIAGDLVESWQQYAEGRPTVLFCSRVGHSQDAVEGFRQAGISAVHVDADTPDDERNRAFDAVAAGKIKVLSNVGIIGEGVDVPELKCVQWFCEVNGRVKWAQGNGRVMRIVPGVSYGIVIDHAGAVFRHGFPDEDTPWTLDGNADEEFKNKHDAGETEKAFYCKRCELAYHGSPCCPQCGREPSKPPRSIFAPPPVRPRHELLTEAERESTRVTDRQEKVQHWFRCLHAAIKRNGSFLQASAIFRRKYGVYPDEDFPCLPAWKDRRLPIAELYPNFVRNEGRA